jgi:hypothetical protein
MAGTTEIKNMISVMTIATDIIMDTTTSATTTTIGPVAGCEICKTYEAYGTEVRMPHYLRLSGFTYPEFRTLDDHRPSIYNIDRVSSRGEYYAHKTRWTDNVAYTYNNKNPICWYHASGIIFEKNVYLPSTVQDAIFKNSEVKGMIAVPRATIQSITIREHDYRIKIYIIDSDGTNPSNPLHVSDMIKKHQLGEVVRNEDLASQNKFECITCDSTTFHHSCMSFPRGLWVPSSYRQIHIDNCDIGPIYVSRETIESIEISGRQQGPYPFRFAFVDTHTICHGTRESIHLAPVLPEDKEIQVDG